MVTSECTVVVSLFGTCDFDLRVMRNVGPRDRGAYAR